MENTKSRSLPELTQLKNGVLRRSMTLAFIIGSLLTLVNQFKALFGSNPIEILPLILVYVTPFIVIAISQYTGLRQVWSDCKEGLIPMIEEHLLATMLSHKIPIRAVTIGFIIGSVNSVIILTWEFLRTGTIGTTTVALLGQAYLLPVLFGFLSQALAFRRASKLIAEYMMPEYTYKVQD